MKQRIKNWWNRFLCKRFGHKEFEEVYVIDLRDTFGFLNKPTNKPLYMVVKEVTCERCGEKHVIEMSKPMRRSELLKQGWFIQKGKSFETCLS